MNDKFAIDYIDNLCNEITLDVKESIVKSVMKNNPNVDKQTLEIFVEENIAERQKNIKKSAIKVYDDFKQNLPQNEGDDLNSFIHKYMQ